jgi:ferritin-like metal-binding protein YciE
MHQIKNAEQLAAQGLKEIHSAERQLVRALPKLTKSVEHEGLRQVLERRREMGQQLVEDLDEIFDQIEVRGAGRFKNRTAEGLIEDVNEHLEEIREPMLRDAALLAAIQKVLHYCIAAWGTSRSMGQLLGQKRVVEVMQRVLDEGKRMDQQLTDLAEREINPKMLEAEQGAQMKQAA